MDRYDPYTDKFLRDTQYNILGTNLAEVGTRAVRGYPIDADALMEKVAGEYGERARDRLYQIIRYMPPAQPEIIYCKDCAKHNRALGDYIKEPNGKYRWFWKYESCPLVEYRGKAQGHEFDYQFCACAERRTDG